QGTEDQFARLAAWAPYTKPGNWPDADMLPIGELRPEPGWGQARSSHLTPDEQRTELTLWSIARSPLILGANLTLLDEPTLALLTNRDLIAINQTATSSSQVLHEGDLIVWQADLPNNRIALAFFNTGDAPMRLKRTFAALSSKLGSHPWNTRDVWAGKDLGRQRGVTVDLPAHASQLLIVNP
ncbi:MAG: glycoside hydrolase family 27 protein, partial [Acidobacteriaceae bacterium]